MTALTAGHGKGTKKQHAKGHVVVRVVGRVRYRASLFGGRAIIIAAHTPIWCLALLQCFASCTSSYLPCLRPAPLAVALAWRASLCEVHVRGVVWVGQGQWGQAVAVISNPVRIVICHLPSFSPPAAEVVKSGKKKVPPDASSSLHSPLPTQRIPNTVRGERLVA